MVDAPGVGLDPWTKQNECFPAQIAHIWAPMVTVRMWEDYGQKNGNMLENKGPLHSVFRRSHCCSKTTKQLKWWVPWELFLIHRQSKKNAIWFKLRIFGHQELP